MYHKRLCMVALALALAFASGASAETVKGKVLIEYWFGNGINDQMASLKADADFPNNPADAEFLDAIDRPDFADMDYWGARLQAWLTPPATGDYTFWTASDDNSEVWLSTDDTPANVALICSVNGWGGYQDWTGTSGSMGPNFKSAPVKLEAGKRYYIETLMTDGTGGGFVTVAWAGPGIGDAPTVIGSAYVEAPTSPLIGMAKNPNPANGAVDEHLGMPRPQLRHGSKFLAALPARISHVLLVHFLLAGDADFFGIDDDYEVAGIEVGGKDRFVLAAQQVGGLRCQAAQHRAVGINHVPFALVQVHFR